MAARIITVTTRLKEVDPPDTEVVKRVLEAIVSAIYYDPITEMKATVKITAGTSGENELENFVRFRAPLDQALVNDIVSLLLRHTGQPFAIGYGGGEVHKDSLLLERLAEADEELSRFGI